MHNDMNMMVSLLRYAERLDARLASAQDRADHLAEVSHRYEEETTETQTPEECDHLDRLCDLAERAREIVQEIEGRIEEAKALRSSLEDGADRRRARRRRSGRRRRERLAG